MFGSSHLGEASSPERVCSSLKGRVSRSSCNRAKHKQTLTRSRLGEPFSLERDDTSLKTRALRLSESSSRNPGQPLLFSPRQDKLGWTRIAVLATIRTCISHTYIHTQNTERSIPYDHNSIQVIQTRGKSKVYKQSANMMNPSFPYLEKG